MGNRSRRAGGYYIAFIGFALLGYALIKLFSGITSGFEFHIWNIELRGSEALIVTGAYILVCVGLIVIGLRNIKSHG